MDKQIAASALRHQSCPPGFVCKTSFCACDLFPFLPHSARQESRAARQGRIRPKINFIEPGKTVGRTQLTLLPQLDCAGQTMRIPVILPAFAFSRFVTETTSLQPNLSIFFKLGFCQEFLNILFHFPPMCFCSYSTHQPLSSHTSSSAEAFWRNGQRGDQNHCSIPMFGTITMAFNSLNNCHSRWLGGLGSTIHLSRSTMFSSMGSLS